MKNATRLEAKTKPLYAAPIPIEDLTENQLKAELKYLRSQNEYHSSKSDLSAFVFGKVPPNAAALEEVVLGAILQDKDAFSIVSDILDIDDFYSDTHQSIFKAILELR